MSYLQFHLVFTLPLLLFVLLINRKNPLSFSKRSFSAIGLLCFLALTYTTPWDSYLIQQNIWTYEPGRVLGTIYYIPFEEYFFFFIQTIIGCLFTSFLFFRLSKKRSNFLEVKPLQWLFAATLFPIGLLLFATVEPSAEWVYLWLIAIWSLPVLCLQWIVGLRVLLIEKKTWCLSVFALCAYFWLADSYAIHKEIWTFPEGTISGLSLFGRLPIEEALFFVVTNLMVVQGYILFTSVDFSRSSFWKLERQ